MNFCFRFSSHFPNRLEHRFAKTDSASDEGHEKIPG